MPFLGKDWRAPGETWVKTTEGWERMKLRPIQVCTDPIPIVSSSLSPECSPQSSAMFMAKVKAQIARRRNRDSSNSISSTDEENARASPNNDSADSPNAQVSFDLESDLDDDWRPHCFVKTSKSKEFVGCTSLSEAFHRLNLGRAVTDVRRFNYICKVVQILVRDKLQNLSGSARKMLLSVVEAIVCHSLESDNQVKTARELVQDFVSGLDCGFHCGSPTLLSHHQGTVSNLCEMVEFVQVMTPAESSEESVTFLDLPRECLNAILKRLPDHWSLMEAAKAHEALESLVENEQRLWRGLCRFHFSPEQIENQLNKNPLAFVNWRHTFFELKKYFGLREIYADMIHICCHCKALFWRDHGHPCVSSEAPSVRVTPQQFVDMLLFL